MNEMMDQIIRNLVKYRTGGRGYVVTTMCEYPSGESVSLYVEQNRETYFVSDAGKTYEYLKSLGIEYEDASRSFERKLRNFGFQISSAEVFVKGVSLDLVPATIASLSNALVYLAMSEIDGYKIKDKYSDFRPQVRNVLDSMPKLKDRIFHDKKIIGASNRPHKFHHVINLNDNNFLAIDTVTNDSNSINSVFAGNMDLKLKEDSKAKQKIIYDDRQKWDASALNLLNESAPLVKFTNFAEVILSDHLM